MARPLSIDEQEVRRLHELNMSSPEIAKELGVHRTTVTRALDRLGLLEKNVSTLDRLPPHWPKILPKHLEAKPLQYIRALVRLIETEGEGATEKVNAAGRWANLIVSESKDIDYDPKYRGKQVCEEGGFKLIDEPAEGGWLRQLLTDALAARERRMEE